MSFAVATESYATETAELLRSQAMIRIMFEAMNDDDTSERNSKKCV